MTDKFNEIILKLVDENDKEQRRNLAIQLLNEINRFLQEQKDNLKETKWDEVREVAEVEFWRATINLYNLGYSYEDAISQLNEVYKVNREKRIMDSLAEGTFK